MAAQKSKQLILDVATALFRERGYDSVSISDICKAAKCSISTFYYQYDSKAALFGEMFSRRMALSDERIAELVSKDSPWEQLWTIHSAFVALHGELGLDLSIQVMILLLKTDTVFFDTPDQVYMCNLVVPIIERGQKLGEIRNPAPARDLMLAVWTMLNGVAYAWAADRATYDITGRLRAMLEIVYDIRPDLRTASKADS